MAITIAGKTYPSSAALSKTGFTSKKFKSVLSANLQRKKQLGGSLIPALSATERFLAADQKQDVINFGGTGVFESITDSLLRRTRENQIEADTQNQIVNQVQENIGNIFTNTSNIGTLDANQQNVVSSIKNLVLPNTLNQIPLTGAGVDGDPTTGGGAAGFGQAFQDIIKAVGPTGLLIGAAVVGIMVLK